MIERYLIVVGAPYGSGALRHRCHRRRTGSFCRIFGVEMNPMQPQPWALADIIKINSC